MKYGGLFFEFLHDLSFSVGSRVSTHSKYDRNKESEVHTSFSDSRSCHSCRRRLLNRRAPFSHIQFAYFVYYVLISVYSPHTFLNFSVYPRARAPSPSAVEQKMDWEKFRSELDRIFFKDFSFFSRCGRGYVRVAVCACVANTPC